MAGGMRFLRRRRLQFGGHRGELAGELAEPPLPHPLLRPLERLEETIVGKRLQNVVDRLYVERTRRVLAERGDEYDNRSGRRRGFRHVETGCARHLDIQERDIDALATQRLARGLRVRAFDDRVHFGVALQQPRDHRPRQRLILGDEHAKPRHAGSPAAIAVRALGNVSSTVVPTGSRGRTLTVAARPYSRLMREVVFRRPVPAC